jgi:hypothetical protein
MLLKLEVVNRKGIKKMDFDVRRLLLAGYSGRNRETVMKHINKLKEVGVPAPDSVPVLYEVDPS